MRDFMFQDLEEILRVSGFGIPTKIRFNTPDTKDMMPACWKIWEEEVDMTREKVKRGYKCICRTVGISPDDIKITQEDYGICLQGETNINDNKYSQYIELPISKEIMSNIKSIKYESLNGLTYIYLEVQSPQQKKIEIKRV